MNHGRGGARFELAPEIASEAHQHAAARSVGEIDGGLEVEGLVHEETAVLGRFFLARCDADEPIDEAVGDPAEDFESGNPPDVIAAGRDADVDSLAAVLALLGTVGGLAQLREPFGEDGREAEDVVEMAEGAEFVVDRKVDLDAVGFVAGKQFFEEAEALVAYFGPQKVHTRRPEKAA